jgi:CDGSH iron-sulfur domain-containing protein 3
MSVPPINQREENRTMPEPHITAKKPEVTTLEPNTYAWCACGHTQNGAFCDGSHRGKGFVPNVFTVEESQKVALCMCKRTQNPPYCDGSHSKL